jgi:hypothetical protein
MSRRSGILMFALLLLIVLAGCDTITQAPAATVARPTAPPTGVLPAFSDWRLAYLGQDGRVHVVTQDGKTDLAGPKLTTSASATLWGQAVIAPNGRAFAYPPDSRVSGYPGAIIDLGAGAASSQGNQNLQQSLGFYWSPDSTRVAFIVHDSSTAHNSWEMIALNSTTPTVIPAAQDMVNTGALIGWIDNTHLAVSIANGNQGTSYTLSSLEVTTGTLRTIASISDKSLGTPFFSLSPDGSEIVLTNGITEGVTSYAPVVELIATSTGQKCPLPTILHVTGSSFNVVAWKPGSQLVLASGGDGTAGSSEFVLDLARDTATPFARGVTPLGWAPDSGTLFVATPPEPSSPSTTPITYQVSMMAALPPATSVQPVFKISSINFPFIGFVRTE